MSEPYLKIPYILFELDITPIERYLLALTISYGGNMRASNNELAKMFCVSRRSVIEAVNELINRKYIDRDIMKNGRVISLASGEIIALLDKKSSEETAPLNNSKSYASSEVFSKSSAETAPNRIYSINNTKNVFDEIRKLYPGIKRGLQTEYKNFQNKHADWKDVLPLLRSAIERQIAHRKQLHSTGQFCPNWKYFQTWINNRCWEEEVPEMEIGTREATEEEITALLGENDD